MAVVENKTPALAAAPSGEWWWSGFGSRRVRAGVTNRQTRLAQLTSQLPADTRLVHAGQVHGSSIAFIERPRIHEIVVSGCDALITGTVGTGLVIRTADCLPVFIQDSAREVIGIAHAGWRGLAARLPLRLVAAFRRLVHSRPEQLRVAIGPAIHACCYEVSESFGPEFEPFLQRREGRLTCDLIGAARAQFEAAGIPADRCVDSGHCTGCEPDQWFSVRREGDAAGRLFSLIVMHA